MGLYHPYTVDMVCLEIPHCLATACWVALASNLPVALLPWTNMNFGIIALPSVAMQFVLITADVAFYVSPMEGSACKVREHHHAGASLRVSFWGV